MSDIIISSDRGLEWGNVVFTPEELAEWVDGISLIDGELVLSRVKVVNYADNEYIMTSKGETILLSDLRDQGISVYLTGGETADVGDLVRTIIVDSTVTARMKRSDVISNDNIKPGNVIVGLASYGQATYEKEYNGGMGSNGLTSARHDVWLQRQYFESLAKSDPLHDDLLPRAVSCRNCDADYQHYKRPRYGSRDEKCRS